MSVDVRIHADALPALESLDAKQRRRLTRWRARLRRDATAGDQIRRDRIPQKLQRKYGINNIWRMELLGGWRALYTIATNAEGDIAVIVLAILEHKQYDRLFGYQTS